MSMSEEADTDLQVLNELQFQLKLRDGDYCAARTGVTLVMFYGKPMRELAAVVTRLLERYLSFIPEGAIRCALSPSGEWREFKKQGLRAAIRRLTAEDADYEAIHLSSGAPGHVGEYGFHFYGSNFTRPEISPRETCACIMEFPVMALAREEKNRFAEFAAEIAEVEPFESGYGGYAFKHLFETWRNKALGWIAQRAQRFVALDISYDNLRRAARGRVANVSWVTLLGSTLVEQLGGESRIREQLSPEILLRPLQTGLMLIAGDMAPVGDANRGLHDIQWLKEVARLTKPVRARMEIGFGSDTFREGWLNRLDG
jgi:hypothetical protein